MWALLTQICACVLETVSLKDIIIIIITNRKYSDLRR